MSALAILAAAVALSSAGATTLPPPALLAVQQAVNSRGMPVDDDASWLPLSDLQWFGNCKNFAMEKRKELIALGYDPSRLALWLGYENGLHAVLIVDHKWVLDSQQVDVQDFGKQSVELICEAKNLSPHVANDDDYKRCGGWHWHPMQTNWAPLKDASFGIRH